MRLLKLFFACDHLLNPFVLGIACETKWLNYLRFNLRQLGHLRYERPAAFRPLFAKGLAFRVTRYQLFKYHFIKKCRICQSIMFLSKSVKKEKL